MIQLSQRYKVINKVHDKRIEKASLSRNIAENKLNHLLANKNSRFAKKYEKKYDGVLRKKAIQDSIKVYSFPVDTKSKLVYNIPDYLLQIKPNVIKIISIKNNKFILSIRVLFFKEHDKRDFRMSHMVNKKKYGDLIIDVEAGYIIFDKQLSSKP